MGDLQDIITALTGKCPSSHATSYELTSSSMQFAGSQMWHDTGLCSCHSRTSRLRSLLRQNYRTVSKIKPWPTMDIQQFHLLHSSEAWRHWAATTYSTMYTVNTATPRVHSLDPGSGPLTGRLCAFCLKDAGWVLRDFRQPGVLGDRLVIPFRVSECLVSPSTLNPLHPSPCSFFSLTPTIALAVATSLTILGMQAGFILV